MIRCPHCGSGQLRVVGGWYEPTTVSMRRTRKCKLCRRNFHTREYIEGQEAELTRDQAHRALKHMFLAARELRKKKD